MDLRAFMSRYADEIGGNFNEYAPELMIMIVPVSGGRAQTVTCEIRHSDLYNRKVVMLSSKICPAGPEIDYRSLLSQTNYLSYSRFAITDNYLQVQASADHSDIGESHLKEMLQEVANVADQFELKITGADVQ
jgi:hypothetical protein